MNIKEEFTCQHCYEIYNHPITLPCGDNICKHHIEELISNSAANKFICPLCNETHSNENFKVNKLIENLIKRKLHDIKFNPKYVETLKNLKTEFQSLEAILANPEAYIFEEIKELMRQVDLDREELKSEIDERANDLIHHLELFSNRFKTEYKTNVDLEHYKALVESSKKQLANYEQFLRLFSVEKEKREKEYKKNDKLVKMLQSNVKKLQLNLFSDTCLIYSPMKKDVKGLFGKLIVKVRQTYFVLEKL